MSLGLETIIVEGRPIGRPSLDFYSGWRTLRLWLRVMSKSRIADVEPLPVADDAVVGSAISDHSEKIYDDLRLGFRLSGRVSRTIRSFPLG